VLDLNDPVESMLKMLRRLIGEDIHLAWLPVMNAGLVNMDPSQIDQILANLCINARDAIVGTGRITIETDAVCLDETFCAGYSDLVPGDYVKLTISDDGFGMSQEIQKNLFEPFFTTKELGKGTGLGLATVYGIVKQNKGIITVSSEIGKGSCFTVFLPRVGNDSNPEYEKVADLSAAIRNITILVVEDSPPLLDMTAKMIKHLGHNALTASTPDEAVRVATEHKALIQLLLTDVIMPDMNGKELSKKLTAIYPGLKTIFMSGYTADIIAHQGVLEQNVNFIQKPFMLKDLLAKINETLSTIH
jgi:CheY-like chemotaxis protein